MSKNFLKFLLVTCNILLSTKFASSALFIKRNTSLANILKRTRPRTETWGTPDKRI